MNTDSTPPLDPRALPQLPEIFSPEHWDAIRLAGILLDRGAEPEPVAAAAALWVAGQQSWLQGLNSPNLSDLALARDCWRLAVRHDAGMADAWAGLCSIRALYGDPGADGAIEALALCADRLGEQQRAHNLAVLPFYVPLAYDALPVETPDDARRQFVRLRTLTGDLESARAMLARCDRDHVRTAAVTAGVELQAGEYERAIALLQRVVREEPRLEVDAKLGIATAMERIGLLHGAIGGMKDFIAATTHRKARLYARYQLTRIYLEHDQVQEARVELECLYAEDVYFRNVAELLGREPAQERLRREQEWTAIVAGVESGFVAEEPEIIDDRL